MRLKIPMSRFGYVLVAISVKETDFPDQILMSESGCIENVSDVLQTTNNPDIKILCLKVFMNVSTNPDFLNEFLLVSFC